MGTPEEKTSWSPLYRFPLCVTKKAWPRYDGEHQSVFRSTSMVVTPMHAEPWSWFTRTAHTAPPSAPSKLSSVRAAVYGDSSPETFQRSGPLDRRLELRYGHMFTSSESAVRSEGSMTTAVMRELERFMIVSSRFAMLSSISAPVIFPAPASAIDMALKILASSLRKLSISERGLSVLHDCSAYGIFSLSSAVARQRRLRPGRD
mmetsp:Transcript_53615/g.111885  ORF Transcript_53615/g.111885 Transcript_53615/m.111885 type:complete len:204 (+) Transcript_53615:193-804(+)